MLKKDKLQTARNTKTETPEIFGTKSEKNDFKKSKLQCPPETFSW